MGEYQWKTFSDVERLAGYFGSGLRELKNPPKENIVIFAETRAEWMIAAHGCFKQSIPGDQTTLNRVLESLHYL